MRKFREKYIGNKDFYKMVLLVAIPIMIQNAITNFVSHFGQYHGRTGWNGADVRCRNHQSVDAGLQYLYFGAVSGAGILGHSFMEKGTIKECGMPSVLKL